MTDMLLRDRGAEAVKENLKFCQQVNLDLYNARSRCVDVATRGRSGTFSVICRVVSIRIRLLT